MNYGIRQLDSGRYGLYKVGRWSPTYKAKFVRYLLDDIAKKYLAIKNLAPIGSDLHIFR